jgi:two-component system sensor histidine kinase/response regulator
MSKFHHSIYIRTIVPAILLTLLLTTAVALYNARIVAEQGLAQAEANAHLLAGALDAGIQQPIDLQPTALQSIIDNLTTANPDTREFNFFLMQGNGSAVVASNDPDNLKTTDAEEHEALQHTLTKDEPLVVMSRELDEPPGQPPILARHLTLTAPVHIGDQPVGAVDIQFILADLERDLLRIRRSFVLVALLETLGIAVVLSFLLRRQVMQPLAVFQQGTTAVTAGDFSINLPIRRENEISRVMADFNLMTASLAANAQAIAELEQLRDDLTGMIVHDMKNPLQVINLSNSLLRNPRVGRINEKQVEIADRIQLATDRLLQMVMNLLNIRRLESDEVMLQREIVDVRAVVEESVTAVTLQAQSAQQIIQVDNLESGQIIADKALLHRVLINLLSNALKHSPPKSATIVRIKSDETSVEIRIVDQGEGVPAAEQEQIFRKFAQASGRKLGGKTDTGLGLAFCKLAVEAHGGTIAVESPIRDGRGSAFIIRLPTESDHSTQA